MSDWRSLLLMLVMAVGMIYVLVFVGLFVLYMILGCAVPLGELHLQAGILTIVSLVVVS